MADDGSTSGASDKANAPQAGGTELQFDRAEYAGKAGLSCTTCQSDLPGEYYRIDGKPVCPECHARVNEMLNGGSGARRFFRAAVFGSLAMVLGGGIYYAVLAATGYEVGLISILVGVMVGSAVRYGSDHRGGWVYQGMAVFLTYTAIVSAYIPLLVSEFSKMKGKKPVATQAAAASPKNAPMPGVTPASAPAPNSAAVSNTEKRVAAEIPSADGDDGADETGEPAAPITGVQLAIGLVILIGVIYAIPFLAGLQNILGLLIIGFGLYQAWKQNIRVQKNIRGPFHANAGAAQEASVGGA